MLDKTQYGKESLFPGDEMKHFQGPSLLVYNNGKFQDFLKYYFN